MLVPIAMHEGCYDKVGNFKGWSRDNTALGILLRRSFFSFRRGAS